MLATTGLAVATSGCLRHVRSAVNRDGLEPLSVTITTLPSDGDRESIRLTRRVRDALEAVGIDASIELLASDEFLRAVLVNHDFDLYVGWYPEATEPAFLYEALHSTYADEPGWQNPFGFTDLAFDDLLEMQRRTDGDERRDAVAETLEAFVTHQPFVPICAPEEYRLVRSDRANDWRRFHPGTPLGYLDLGAGGGEIERLRAVHTDPRPSWNLNPLSVEYRNRGLFTGLLYDPLAVTPAAGTVDDEGDPPLADGGKADARYHPWLAESWEWAENEDGGTLTVELRDDCRFHDGEPVTPADVEFTYRFLVDTTLGGDGVSTPSPRHRGHVAPVVVDEIDADGARIELPIAGGEPAAERALAVPILPEHVWRERSASTDVTGVQVADGTTDAVVLDNVPAIGSGPFEFVDRNEREYVTFQRYDDHFTLRNDVDLPGPTVEEFRVRIDPRSTSAIEIVSNGDADVTTDPLESYVVDETVALAAETEGVELLESPARTFYHVGFNFRKAPFGNPHFRRIVARLLDEAWLVDDVFDGHARPLTVPVTEEWTPDALAWDGDDPAAPFLGSDGEIDDVAARDAFESAGFSYDADGRLRVRR
ncbi:ABC transporter substrate-binding protein [Natronobacterium gregoryi]|nr:ABC transporter substrate-binding protein [Natronobacterium gregoryi]AFZ71867.1 extracellular solute-binding protein, family 5 [Natronobacterium gregoryi SP2]SFJ50725.1 peptide/nickel transport system substrate-binding protein [Natronobacterium gregoryi]